MIEMCGLTKRYRRTLALHELTCSVEAGRVTGFLGPNGAGKSTTMKLLLGLAEPTAGSARIDGRPYRDHEFPLRSVGATLESSTIHPGRRIRDHLAASAAANDIPGRRVPEVLELVGLAEVAGKRGATLSLGMAQRVALAGALLGDPGVLLLDEPMNGLDPTGIIWLRGLLRGFAKEGRTVLVSSHLLNEMAVTVDHVLLLGRGRLLADASIDELLRQGTTTRSLETAFVALTAAARPFDATTGQ